MVVLGVKAAVGRSPLDHWDEDGCGRLGFGDRFKDGRGRWARRGNSSIQDGKLKLKSFSYFNRRQEKALKGQVLTPTGLARRRLVAPPTPPWNSCRCPPPPRIVFTLRITPHGQRITWTGVWKVSSEGGLLVWEYFSFSLYSVFSFHFPPSLFALGGTVSSLLGSCDFP